MRSRAHGRSVVAVALLLAALGAALCAAPEPALARPRALIAFLPTEPEPKMPLLYQLAAREELAIGLTSPTLGGYLAPQMGLDLSQGSRISTTAYPDPLQRLDLVQDAEGGRIRGFAAAVRRARRAPGRLTPGLLGDAVRDGGGRTAYVGVAGFEHVLATVAADRGGRIGEVSLGTLGSFGERAISVWRRSELVVAQLPPDRQGLEALDRLLAARTGEDLLYVVRAPPGRGLRLLPTGLAAPGFEGVLTSATTRTPGLVAATDIAPTVLRRLGHPVPVGMEGRPIESRPDGDPDEVRALSDRLGVVVPRRGPVLQTALLAFAGMFLVLVLVRRREGARTALRIGFLASLWLPGLALATAALGPAETLEVILLTAAPVALAVATDRLLPWPAAPAAPAGAVLAAYAVDFGLGSRLTSGSLGGPNPMGGARFYGAGNELEVILAVIVLLGTGAGLTLASPRHVPRAFAAVCLVAAVVLGAGRLGADVGGVITMGAGGATAVLLSRRGHGRSPSRRAIALAVAVPVLGVAGLIALDLLTGGGAHLTRSVLEAEGPGDLSRLAERRVQRALGSLSGSMPLSVGVAAGMLAAGVWQRRRLFAPLDGLGEGRGLAFRAGAGGALCVTVVAPLANDSGPIMFVIGAIGLVLAVGYANAWPAPRGTQARAPWPGLGDRGLGRATARRRPGRLGR